MRSEGSPKPSPSDRTNERPAPSPAASSSSSTSRPPPPRAASPLSSFPRLSGEDPSSFRLVHPQPKSRRHDLPRPRQDHRRRPNPSSKSLSYLDPRELVRLGHRSKEDRLPTRLPHRHFSRSFSLNKGFSFFSSTLPATFRIWKNSSLRESEDDDGIEREKRGMGMVFGRRLGTAFILATLVCWFLFFLTFVRFGSNRF